MTYQPLCSHRRTNPVRAANGTRYTRCVSCGLEFALVDHPPGQAPRTLRRERQNEREQAVRLAMRRDALFFGRTNQ